MGKDDHIKNVTRGAAIIFIGMFIGRFFGYTTRIVMARFFGADAYGLFSLAAAILGIATTISLLGIPVGLSRFISFYIGKNDQRRIKGVILSAFKITIPTSIIIGAFVYFFANDISIYFFNEPRLVPLLQTFSLIVPFSVIFTLFLDIFRGFQKTKYKVIIEDIIKPTLTLAFVIIFFLMGYQIFGAIIAYSIGYFICFFVGAFLLTKTFPVFGSKIKSISITKKLFSFSWPLIIMGYLWMFITWTDIIMLGFYKTAQEVGFYSAALTASGIMSMIEHSFIFIFMPVISELYAKNKRDDIINVHNTVIKWIFIINLSLFLLIITFPDKILGILFGEEYIIANMTLIVLATGFVLSTLGSLSGSGLIIIGKTKLILTVVLIGFIINFLMNLMLIPLFGILGAAFATMVSFVSMTAVRIFFAHKYLGFGFFNRVFIKALISGVISITILYFSIKILYMLPLIWIIMITLPLFIFSYTVSFVALKGLDKNDIMIIKSIENKIGIEMGILKKILKRFL